MSSNSALVDGEDTEARGKLIDETLSLSAPAADYVKGYLEREGKADSPIRVAAVRTHCMGGKGFGYSITEDTEKQGDAVLESNGVRLLVDRASMQYLKGAQVGYEEALQGGGLIVHNPNAVGKCHCGHHDLFDGQGHPGEEGC